MKIAMIGQKGLPATYGGIERHVEEIGARLVERGHEVRVYTRSYYSPGKDPFRGMERCPRPTIRTKHLDTASHALFATLDVLVRPVDLVHYHALGPSALAGVPRLRGIPTVVTLHGLDWEREKWGAMASYLLQRCEYPAVHFPNRTIVVSKTLQHYCEDKYLIRPEYIPNGVNPAREQPAELLAKWDLAPKDYFLFVGRLTPEKGAHLLVDAFARTGSQRKLVIAGGSAFTDTYVEDLKSAASPNTIFTGYVHGEDLEALYTHAYAVVLPSTLEGLSIALLEALSYGRCVLVSDIPENMEVVEDAVPHFRSRDADALAEALRRMDRHPEEIAASEAVVRERLARRFTWDVVVSELEALYREVLAGKRAQPVEPPPLD
jgi:glycosyltransferase involved in cell wall biosynthesis